MAKTPRNIPANFPQPWGSQMLRAEIHRQISMLRQENVTDLLAVLAETKEPGVRNKLTKLIESYLKTGINAAHKAEELWPELEKVKESFLKNTDAKPAVARKHLALFEQLDKVQRRSLDLLENSFENIRLILDRLRPPEPSSNALQPGLSKASPRPSTQLTGS